MPYPPGSNRQEEVGSFYDWTVPGSAVTSKQYWVPYVFSGGMPIHSTHRQVNGKFQEGGAWLMWKLVEELSGSQTVTTYRRSWNRAYHGRYSINGHLNTLHRPTGWNSQGTLNSLSQALFERGAEAWNRARPDNPDFSLATSMYELRETPALLKASLLAIIREIAKDRVLKKKRFWGKNLQGRSRSSLSKAGEFHLALSFGYLPLLSDIRKFVLAQREKQKRLTQLIRDAGKPIRRRSTLKDSDNVGVSNVTSATGVNGYASGTNPTHVSQCYADGYATEKRTTTTLEAKTWVVGKFRYYLPPGPRDVVWTRNMMRRIMGWRITPSNLYAIMPWSWLADYFSGLGHFLQAISGGVADRLAADYCYLMRTFTRQNVTSFNLVTHAVSNPLGPKNFVDGSLKSRSIIKMRVVASPFGFGVLQQNLTPRQWGILGALGLSRLP